jgi:FlaA1/EpsC-like NDP-sugar epimerase
MWKDISKIIFFEKRRITRLIFFLIADGIFLSFSVFLAFLVRFEGKIPLIYFLNIPGIIILALFITLLVFYFFGLYHFNWRYVGEVELISLVKGTILSFLFLTGAFFVLKEEPIFSGFPRSVLFITYFFVFIFSAFIRFAYRIYEDIFDSFKKKKKERVLIVGAGDAGELILRNILNLKNSPYEVKGLVDDSPSREGILIHGFKVLGKIDDIPKIVREKKIEGLIIAMPSVDATVIKRAVEKGREAKLRKIKIVPAIEEVMAGNVNIGQLRDVEIEDLLEREPLSLDQRLVEEFISGKRILVTGAAGSIGSELCRQIAAFPIESLILLDQDETGIFNISEELKNQFPKLKTISLICDIRDKEKVEAIFNRFKPQIVFHAAAYKHVPLMEENPDEAVKNNVFGTKIVAESSVKNRVEKFIFISTDKAVNPTSVMGATKRLGEMICQALNERNITKFISVRFGNVLGSRGSVIPIFREKIRKREPIEVTHPEMKRYFMITSEACLLVLQAGAMGQGGEVFVLDMGDPIKIINLAKEMIRLSGLEVDKDIPIVFTEPRAGEKLFEEILTDGEEAIATKNKKIFIAKLAKVNETELEANLEKLEKSLSFSSKENIKEVLREIIPNYQPSP